MSFSLCKRFVQVSILFTAIALTTQPCAAQTASTSSSSTFGSAIVDYFANWFKRASQIQSEQPRWVTPIVTVTPRLEQEFRYDQFWQGNQKGVATDNFGGGKGLELIPFQNTEIILGVPNWVAHNGAIQHGRDIKTDGWAEETFLVK